MSKTINNLNEFFYSLQYNPNELPKIENDVGFYSKPLPFKIYEGKEIVRLEDNIPNSIDKINSNSYSPSQIISFYLWYVYGFMNYNWLQKKMGGTEEKALSFFRRSIGSGGGLYPGELYLYIEGIEGIETGIYYFDIRGPQLVFLKKGNFKGKVEKFLNYSGNNNIYVFLTSFYWKNFFKYLNFSYRLQGLDLGAIISQSYLIAKEFNMEFEIKYNFDDILLNKLLGIDIEEETLYAVMPLTLKDVSKCRIEDKDNTVTSEDDFYGYINHLNEGPKSVCSTIQNINKVIASNVKSTRKSKKCLITDNNPKIELCSNKVSLPYDVFKASVKRVSPGESFKFDSIDIKDLYRILDIQIQNEIVTDMQINTYSTIDNIQIYFYANNVKGLSKGYYYYDSMKKSFQLVKQGDYSQTFQDSLTRKNFNLMEVPVIVHLVSTMSKFLDELGPRGYRILQMEAGRVMHQIQLNSSSLELGSHPMLSYLAKNLEDTFNLNKNILVQMAIGKYKPLLRLTNNLL
ncbi:SagB family peptide dehydrogenase [Priestia megaterium]